MKLKGLLAGISAITLMIGVMGRASAQTAPGVFADANQPSGAPDPEKLDTIWSVDPINDQVSIKVPFSTTPQGGRGPKVPFALLYNSGSTVTLQSAGVVGLGNGAQASVFTWSAHPTGWIGSLNGPTGPWTTTGPYFYSGFSDIPDYYVPGPNGSQIFEGAGCTIYGPYTYVDQDGVTHDMNLLGFIANPSQTGNTPWAPTCQGAQSASTTYWPTSMTSDGSAMCQRRLKIPHFAGRKVPHPLGMKVYSSSRLA